MREKVVVTAAITGAIHTPTMSPFLPVTPGQIAGDAVASAAEGAAEVHLHARDPKDGKPSSELSLFREIIQEVKAHCDVMICLTTGGGKDMSVQERFSVVSHLRPELASLNMGSLNFGMFPMTEKYPKWKHEWEQPFLESTRDFIFRNTFKDIGEALVLMRNCGTKPELEIYDVGHLYNVKYFLNKGLINPPLYIQFVTGILGGIGSEVENLVLLKQTADRLLGANLYHWSAVAAGRMQMPICVTSAFMGGSCRVGLEDNLYIGRNVLAKSNAEQVRKMVELLGLFSLEVATSDEARKILRLNYT